MPLPTFWQGIILGKGSGILQINWISEQMQEIEKKETLSRGKVGRAPETQNCNSAGDQVREKRLTHIVLSCVTALIYSMNIAAIKIA